MRWFACFLTFLIIPAAPANGAKPVKVKFTCHWHGVPDASNRDLHFTASCSGDQLEHVLVTDWHRRHYPLPRTDDSDGRKYSNPRDRVIFVIDGDARRASLQIIDVIYLGCDGNVPANLLGTR